MPLHRKQYNDGITSVNAIGNRCQIDCWHNIAISLTDKNLALDT